MMEFWRNCLFDPGTRQNALVHRVKHALELSLNEISRRDHKGSRGLYRWLFAFSSALPHYNEFVSETNVTRSISSLFEQN